MAIEVTKVYTEHFPALRFVGMRYTNDDRENGGFGKQWGEWWADDRFSKLKAAVARAPFDASTIGLMTMRGDMAGFTYWIGLFFPADAIVPDPYDSIDLPESDIGVGWVRGNAESGEIYGDAHGVVCKALEEAKLGDFRNDIAGEGSDIYCFFERYNCPRFTVKDANGNVTLDYGNYLR